MESGRAPDSRRSIATSAGHSVQNSRSNSVGSLGSTERRASSKESSARRHSRSSNEPCGSTGRRASSKESSGRWHSRSSNDSTEGRQSSKASSGSRAMSAEPVARRLSTSSKDSSAPRSTSLDSTRSSSKEKAESQDEQEATGEQRARRNSGTSNHSGVSVISVLSTASSQQKRMAREQVCSVVREHTDLAAKLGLPVRSKEFEVVEALKKADEPFCLLREVGCSVDKAVKTCEVLPEVDPPPPEQPLLSRARQLTLCASVGFLIALILLSVALWGLFTWKKDFRFGACLVNGFTNATAGCAGTCTFVVHIHDREKNQHFEFRSWKPMTRFDYFEDKILWDGEPFRCCPGVSSDCCGMVDKNDRFCDQWHDITDADGYQCPSGRWDCLFKTKTVPYPSQLPDVVDYVEEVTDLQLANPPPTLELITIAASCGVLGCCCLCLQKRRLIPQRNCTHVTVLKDVEAGVSLESFADLKPSSLESTGRETASKKKKKDVPWAQPVISPMRHEMRA